MRFTTTLLLLLVLVGLGGYVYFVEYPQSQEEAKPKKLYDFKADDATEVTLTYADREVVLQRKGDAWQMLKPIEAEADSVTVKNLVGAIADCELKKELTDTSSDLAQYGLDKPFVTVAVKLKDRQLTPVSVGKMTPIGMSAYVQRADDKKVLLAGGAFRSGLDKQTKDFRDKTLLGFTDDELARVEITGNGRDIALVNNSGSWAMERPAAYPADAPNVRSFLSSLRALRASDFIDQPATDPGQYGFDDPRLQIRLSFAKDNRQKTIRFGAKDTDKKEPYVQVDGSSTTYTVSEFSLKDLSKNANDFRDKTVLAFDREAATSIAVQRKDGTQFKLVRGADKQWNVDGNEGKPAATIANQYLGDVRDLKGYEILVDNPVDLAEYGLDQPMLTISVHDAEQKLLGTIKIAERPNTDGKKEFVAAAEGGTTVFLVRDYSITRLNKQASDFIPPPPGSPAPAAAGIEAAPPGGNPGDEGEAFDDVELGSDEGEVAPE